MDIPSISAVSVIVAALGVLIGFVFAILEVRNLVKTRQIDLVVRLHSIMGGKDFLEAWEKFIEREITDYDGYKEEYGFVELNKIEAFLGGIGVLLRRKLTDIGLVEDFFSIEVKMVWEKLKPFAEEVRQIRKSPEVYSNIEYLYNEMQKREQTLQSI